MVTLLLWMGVSFETPMVIVFLAKLEIVNHRQLRCYWKYAFSGHSSPRRSSRQPLTP